MTDPQRHRRTLVRILSAVLLLVLLVVFAVENRSRTRIRFLIPEVDAPLWTALFVSTLFGVVAGALLSYRDRR